MIYKLVKSGYDTYQKRLTSPTAPFILFMTSVTVLRPYKWIKIAH